MRIPMAFNPVGQVNKKIWLNTGVKQFEQTDLDYCNIAKERLTAIANEVPFVLPDGFRFMPISSSSDSFPYEILLPDGKIVKTSSPDTAEINARVAEAAINQKYGIIPVSQATAAQSSTTTTATNPTPAATPMPTVNPTTTAAQSSTTTTATVKPTTTAAQSSTTTTATVKPTTTAAQSSTTQAANVTPTVIAPEPTVENPLQVPADFYTTENKIAEANDKSSYIIGGCILLGAFLLIWRWRSKKNKKNNN